MNDHQKAYLSKGGMTEEFLQQAMTAGFDIHHVDGDHDNNDPDNLVLIWSGDHMAVLHGLKKFAGRGNGVWMTYKELAELKLTKGERAYKLRLNGDPWEGMEIPNGMLCAKHYAKVNDLEWPVPLPKREPKPRKIKSEAESQRSINKPVRNLEYGDMSPKKIREALKKKYPAPKS